MNARFGKISALITAIGVLSFAISMILGFFTPTIFFSCFSSMIIAFGFLPLMASLASVNHDPQTRAIGMSGVAFGVVYVLLVFLVYYAQCTTVRMNASLGTESLSIISYSHIGSLFFNYDLLGYGMMALSTFLIGFTIRPIGKQALALRMMLWLHGLFFLPCFILPMFPIFTPSSDSLMSVIMLECWCAFFLPLCWLCRRYFARVEQLG